MPQLPPVRSILVNGTVGVGKTTTAHAIGQLLVERRVPHAVIDLDALRTVWPAPDDDPFNEVLQFQNLEAVVRNSRRAGVETFVVAGVVETSAAVTEHRRVLGDSLFLVRLRLPVEEVTARLERRHDAEDPGLVWHLNRAGELDGILTMAALDDAVLDVDGLSPQAVAERLVASASR